MPVTSNDKTEPLPTYALGIPVSLSPRTGIEHARYLSDQMIVLHELSSGLSQSVDLLDFFNTAFVQLQQHTQAQAFALFVQENGQLLLRASQNLSANNLPNHPSFAVACEGILRKGAVALCALDATLWTAQENTTSPDAMNQSLVSDREETNFLFVPTKANHTTNGLLLVGPFKSLDVGEETERIFWECIANLMGVAIENARLSHTLLKARQEIELAMQAKDRFLAMVSHELRAPLNSIRGWSSALLTQPIDGDLRQRALEIIDRSARTQTQLIEDLLDMANALNGKLRLEITSVDLTEVIHAVLDVVRPAAEAKSIRLQTILDATGTIIAGDPDRLHQIIWNLLSNAVKFTPPHGLVELKLERQNNHAQITVRDTGYGLAKELLPCVFDRFWQADSSNTRRFGGLGLGLSLVQELVELHGGKVQAESEGNNHGATFIVSLPIRLPRSRAVSNIQESLVMPGTDAQPKPLLAGLTVLVVESEPHISALVAHGLEQYGAGVLTVRSGADAFSLLPKLHPDERPDVLVVDTALPGENGVALLRNLRNLPAAQNGKLPAIAITAHGSSRDRVQALSAGFQMQVSKPVEPAELALVIASVAGRNVFLTKFDEQR